MPFTALLKRGGMIYEVFRALDRLENLLSARLGVCNVLAMVSYFGKTTSSMAFLTGDIGDHIAKTMAYRWAGETLFAWLDGREKDYAVRAVVVELGELFGTGATLPCRLINKALSFDPWAVATRSRLVMQALDLLGQQVEANGAATHVPYRD